MAAKRIRRAASVRTLLAGLLSLLLVPVAILAHDPRRKNPKPSKATPAIKAARAKMDAAKAKMAAAGKYDCCIKPTCDMCARNGGTCECAASVAAGRGACGECLEGWHAGLGVVKGVEPGAVTLRPSTERPVDDELKRIEELALAREALDSAKRTLATEGRYACCIGGGCDSCAYGADCPCGSNLADPSSAKEKKGVCGECLDGWHAGHGSFSGVELSEVTLGEMNMGMPSSFGVGTMFRQGSGTSWLPDSTPMYALMKQYGNWMLMAHAIVHLTYSKHTGPRGGEDFYGTNWFMASAQRAVKGLTSAGTGTLLFRGMVSLDPATVGGDGYPLLFQTGETYKGRPLVDRQHPHDFVMELAVAYSAPLTKNTFVSAYFAPMGEPALGPAAFPHRISAIDNPEAPLGHHWQDSTHIASGVVTLGIAQKYWKVEGSAFTGREPDERRWNIERPRFDSWSTRFSLNPHPNWSMQVSYGFLREPETIEPGVNTRRLTASVSHQMPVGDRSYLASAFVWGRNLKSGGLLVRDYATDAILGESTFSWRDRISIFGRYERAEKDELFGAGEHAHDPLIFPIHRYTVGGVYNLPLPGAFDWGVGTSVSLHQMPEVLKLFYGNRPTSVTVFLRFRAKRMGVADRN
ncbi:MAG: hypothetical protein ABI882_07195 [Acidobacteriota bacterium]